MHVSLSLSLSLSLSHTYTHTHTHTHTHSCSHSLPPPLSSWFNCALNLMYFSLVGLFSSRLVIAFALMMTCVSLVFSVYLLYILVYVMNKICLICMPVHFINLLTFILFTVKWRTTDSAASQRDSSKKTQ